MPALPGWTPPPNDQPPRQTFNPESIMTTSVTTRLGQLRSRLNDRLFAFKPSVETLPIAGLDIRFLFATPQAVEWYEPIGAHLHAEFEWIANRIAGRTEAIIDAGAYHGLYALVMGKAAGTGSRVAVVDPVTSNCAIIEANLALNKLDGEIFEAAVTTQDGFVSFTEDSCGRIDASGRRRCAARRLPSIMADATVAKIDIEGAEAQVLPQQIDEMSGVHTWMVELHPDLGVDAGAIIGLFAERGFTLERLDRDAARVVPHTPGDRWDGRSTLMATRPF